MIGHDMPKRDECVKEFARLLVEGKLSKIDAYRRAFARPDMTADAASKAASRLSKKDEVVRLIGQLNAKLDKEVVAGKQELAETLTRMVRNDEASDVVRMRAIQLLSDMMGYKNPEKIEINELKEVAIALYELKQEPLVRGDVIEAEVVESDQGGRIEAGGFNLSELGVHYDPLVVEE